MRTINPFPAFSPVEMDELRKKIVHGIAIETFFASPIAHRQQAEIDGKEWVKAPCWIHNAQWQDGKGFLKFRFKGHALYIHRASCEVFNSPVPTNKIVDHLCRVRNCCQPLHLEAVTHEENIKRGANQNHLLRKGALPPVTAKDVNPDFWKQPTVEQFDSEYFRRQAGGREVRRYHCIQADGPVPEAPPGFVWRKVPADETGDTWVLNPVRQDALRCPTRADAFVPPHKVEHWGQAALGAGLDAPLATTVPVFGYLEAGWQSPTPVKPKEMGILWDDNPLTFSPKKEKERWYQRWARKARAWLDEPVF